MSEKGSIAFRKTKSGGHYYVRWCIGADQYRITRYKGLICETPHMADRLLSVMRSDWENGVFRIERYLHQETDITPFLEDWLLTQAHLSPATRKDYENSVKNHLAPWFRAHPIMLHEIQYDTLCALLNDIKREGKGKLNVMFALHSALIHAQKSGKIAVVPTFPERRRYQIEPKPIQAVSEARQIAIINAIPIEHQPIFWWLKYHYRRPSEALALFKEDYDPERDCFLVRRSFSNKTLVQHTKTHRVHTMPCHPEFKPWLGRLHKSFGPYLFTHNSSRMDGQRYQHDYLVDLWNGTARKQGEHIRMYAGLKHSSCSAFINEQGGSVDELQMLTDHARRDSVLKYAEIRLEAKRRIQGKVIKMKEAKNGLATN
ncbi:MAG: site-specific integrase [Planctomycetes bacterium]|nr:site-specific integrase [Planctomycetota bacterium]